MNRNILIVCNTPYQIFCATWIKFNYFENDYVDIIISNHMGNSEQLFNNLKELSLFNDIFYVKTKGLLYKQSVGSIFKPFCQLQKYFIPNKKYDVLLTANIDAFTSMLFYAIKNGRRNKRANKKLVYYLYEDGIATYSKSVENRYLSTRYSRRLLRWYKQIKIYGNLSGVFVFDKTLMMWNPNAPIIEMPKMDLSNQKFNSVINSIFDYQTMTDSYDKKYIFMEEGWFADGHDIDDVELVSSIAERVGKENIMVKIHPRNPRNRFKELGFKTNENTSIPWEVILLNEDIGEDKILFTFASTAAINPIRIFGQNIKVFSLYKCMEKVPSALSGALWETSEYMYKKYYPTIKIVENLEEIFEDKDNLLEIKGRA